MPTTTEGGSSTEIFFKKQTNTIHDDTKSKKVKKVTANSMTTRPSPASIALDAVKKTLPEDRRSRVPDITLPSGSLSGSL
jgi:hypothetical protein